MNNCFCAMFDIIGFSNLCHLKGTEALYQLYNRSILTMLQHAAMPEFKEIVHEGKKVLVPDPKSQKCSYIFFSDTIVFYTKDDSLDSFLNIVLTSLRFLKSGFGGLKHPYRGAIGYGDLISDPSGILIGTSLIDAHNGEKSQMWSGCILTNNCEDYCSNKNYFKGLIDLFDLALTDESDPAKIKTYKQVQKTLVKYMVPKQNNRHDSAIEYFEKEHYVIDWTHKVYEGASDKSFHPAKSSHQEAIKKNTIKFEAWARANNR